MTRTRHALTWPFRRLAGLIGGSDPDNRDREQQALDAAFEHYLLALRGEALARRHPWWRAAAAELASRETAIKERFDDEVAAYRQAFQPRIDRLSEDLYRRLQENPLTLNALRATRVSADAGGIVLAFKTGTLGLYDALFAPAVVSLTSFLTESAVGQYLKTVIAGLKREQVDLVTDIVQRTLEKPLREMQPRDAGLYGIGRQELEQARQRVGALGQ